MNEPSNDNRNEEVRSESEGMENSGGSNRGAYWAAVFFFVAMIAGVGYAMHEKLAAQQTESQLGQMQAMLDQTKGQVADLAAKLQAQSTPPEEKPGPIKPKAVASGTEHASAKPARVRHARADDPRWKQVQSDLAENKKQIEDAQQELANTRQDLENKLNSSHDELNGSIARNHDDLVALQKRGERNYFEFDLVRSKRFQRVGPIGIALRKANHKHLFCDLNLLVDDNSLSKKHVNLYEPVQFYPADYGQPLEIVIYQISKNEARGYVSAPKYRQSELSQAVSPQITPGSTAAVQTPASLTKSADLNLQTQH